MILLLTLLIILSSTGFAENNSLLAVKLSGAPNNFAEVHESVNLYIDSDTKWDLEVSAKSLKTVFQNKEVVLPPDRLSIRVNNGNWIKLQEHSQCLASGNGPSCLTLEYCFNPNWEDLSLSPSYETDIVYHLSSGTLYTSLCTPQTVEPGSAARIVFSNERLKKAHIKVSKGNQVVFQKTVNDCTETSIDTKEVNGTVWPCGEYGYEVTSQDKVVTKGSFTVLDTLNWGILKGSLKNIVKNDGAFLEVYNDNAELVSRKAGAEAKTYMFHLKEGTYSLHAGTQNGFTTFETVTVLGGEVINRDIHLKGENSLQVEAFLTPETLKEGSRGTLALGVCNLSKETIKDLLIEITLPEGVVWLSNGQSFVNKTKPYLDRQEKIKIDMDFVALPIAKKGEHVCEIKVSAYKEDGTFIQTNKTCIFQVKRGLLSEPGILIGESSEPFYLADGTHIKPQDGFFSLQLEPGSYGLLIGNQPYILNASNYSERIKLKDVTEKKNGLVEVKANLTESPSAGIKGFYSTDSLKLAFIYPYVLPKSYNHTPYPTWGTKHSILDKTPWQISYKLGDIKFGAGTVYSTSPLKETYASTALLGAEVDLSPEEGLQCKLTGGFYLEQLRKEEFLADGTTGPFVLKSLPKDGSVRLVVESRNSRNQVIKTYAWEFYTNRKSIKLKTPLVEEDQLGLKNYLVVTYLCETNQKSDKFFGGGHIGYKQKDNGLYLYRHLENEGIMGTLSYHNLSLKGNLGKNSQDTMLSLGTAATSHKIRLQNAKETSLSYQFDYKGTFDTNIYLIASKGQHLNRGEFSFNFENNLFRAMLKQKLTKEEEDFRNYTSEYSFYSGSLKWPKSLVWSISREGFNGKEVDTFSTRMMYKILGFSGYVEGVWRKPREGKPSVAVSLSHDKVPLTVSAQWEHISPEFSLLEVCYDTKAFWTKVTLCNEKSNLKRTLGLTVLPKDSLLYVGLWDDDLKTEYHLPLSKTALKLSMSGNLDTKILNVAAEVDVTLSKRSQLGVTGIYDLGMKNNFRLQGFYRFKTDNFQLETRLAEKDTGIYLTYLIPLGSSSK